MAKTIRTEAVDDFFTAIMALKDKEEGQCRRPQRDKGYNSEAWNRYICKSEGRSR